MSTKAVHESEVSKTAVAKGQARGARACARVLGHRCSAACRVPGGGAAAPLAQRERAQKWVLRRASRRARRS
jgi:hypothetical protein